MDPDGPLSAAWRCTQTAAGSKQLSKYPRNYLFARLLMVQDDVVELLADGAMLTQLTNLERWSDFVTSYSPAKVGSLKLHVQD